ncbi:10900_t:CDS:2 [Funneliformis geosporum]|uniref:10900_t:CDS:1 n=1 Tax=Funneliformis geosporum TaxID=1117311 RepID=A0A9W4WZS1_9GLOM|nr:10900_t:CDS:2 [Funneliformis geosporum]
MYILLYIGRKLQTINPQHRKGAISSQNGHFKINSIARTIPFHPDFSQFVERCISVSILFAHIFSQLMEYAMIFMSASIYEFRHNDHTPAPDRI